MKKIFIMILFISLVLVCSFGYAAQNSATKNIVSIVYDDSSSMTYQNNFCYSDYALQTLVALMNSDDELAVSKVGNPYNIDELDLKDKQGSINEIQKYTHISATMFEAVETAQNWLTQKKDIYTDTANYWLVIITDGEFSGIPSNINTYFDELNTKFNGYNYESIYLGIGSITQSYSNLESYVKNSPNSNILSASSKDEVYTAIMKIASIINNGASDNTITMVQTSSNTISVTTKYPLNKMIMLVQNTDSKVVTGDANLNLECKSYDVAYGSEYSNVQGTLPELKGEVYEFSKTGTEIIPMNTYTITFDKSISTSDITFICEAQISCKISIVDNYDVPYTEAQLKAICEDEKVRVKCVVENNGVSIKSADFSKATVQIIKGKNKYNMNYDSSKNAFYVDLTFSQGQNSIYALAEVTNLFRLKSDVLTLDILAKTEKPSENMDLDELMEVEIPYSSSRNYIKVNTMSFKFVEQEEYNVVEDFKLGISGLPDGVKFEYNGVEYGNGDEIPMTKEYDKTYTVGILVNRDYDELDSCRVNLELIPVLSNSHFWWTGNNDPITYVTLTPKAYKLVAQEQNSKTTVNVQKENLNIEIARINVDSTTGTEGVLGYISSDDISNIKTNSNYSTGYTYIVKKNNEKEITEVTFKPNIFALFKSNKLKVSITFELYDGKQEATYEDEITLTNIDALAILMPYIIGAVVIILILGYATKKKFNKKAQITITENGERVSYALKPSSNSAFIPFVPHKTKIGIIEFTAGKNNEIYYSGKNLEILKIDDENFEDYKEANRVNLDKIVMKKDTSSVVINAYEVEQKYEYLSKDSDMAGYGEDSGSDDAYSSYGSDSSSDYSSGDYGDYGNGDY